MKPKAKIISYILPITIFFTSFSVVAQEKQFDEVNMVKMGNNKYPRYFSITPSIGWLHSWGDFKKDGFMPSFLQGSANEFGFGGNINYHLSPVFSISAGMLLGELEGRLNNVATINAVTNNVDYGRGIKYNTNIMELTLPRINFNLTRAIFKDKISIFNKASINLFVSHGLVYYNSKIYPQNGPEVNLLYSKERGRTGSTTEAVTSFGGSFNYKINEKFDLGLESSIRNVYNDKLDAWVGGDYNDKYSYTALTVTYHFRKAKAKITPKEEMLANKPGEDAEVVEELSKTDEVEPEVVDLPNLEDQTVFGEYKYKSLPMANTAIVVLDENGEPIDTIYTDAYGKFKYQKLNSEDEISFAVLNKEDLEDSDVFIEVKNNDGVVVQKAKVPVTGNQKVVVAKKEEKAERKENKKPEVKITGYRYYVTVAAFRGKTSSGLFMTNLESKGENPEMIRNLQDTWYLITIGLYPTKEEALKEMKKARAKGYDKAWVHILPPKK